MNSGGTLLRRAGLMLGVTIALGTAPAHGQVAASGETACVQCHADASRVPTVAARAPVELIRDDVHGARGYSCHDCHGGDPSGPGSDAGAMERAHDPQAGFVGRPAPADIPAFCGKCHSKADVMAAFSPDARIDQEALYATSVHGKQLAAGDTKVATCISCHGSRPDDAGPASAHGMRAVADPTSPVFPTHVAATCAHCHADVETMKSYRIPTDQYSDYLQSVHAKQLLEHEDLSAPTCNDCHGNHGARPPGVETIANICGTCHGRQSELFRQSTMMVAFDMMNVGECIMCHENHRIVPPDDSMLIDAPLAKGAPETGCYQCHSDADDEAVTVSAEMRRALESLVTGIGDADAVIHDAAFKGMPVAEAKYQLAGARDALIEARAQVHRFEAPPVVESVDRGLKAARGARAVGARAVADYAFRHRWLAVSLVGIAVVIVALACKVRAVDRRWRDTAGVKAGPS